MGTLRWISLFILLIGCRGQKLELQNKEKLAKVLEDIRARIILDDDGEIVGGSGLEQNDEKFVANLVVRPDFPVNNLKYKSVFLPHFEHNTFEFMVPEGEAEKLSVMAILPFVGLLNAPSPQFILTGNGSEFLDIGNLTITRADSYALVEVPIIKQKGINMPYGNGSYSLSITARQQGMEHKAGLSIEMIPITEIEFLSIRPGSLELIEGEESVNDASGQEPDAIQSPPELDIIVKGAMGGIFSISESLPRFSTVPNIEIEVYFKNHSLVSDYIELTIEPSDLFAVRPQMVSHGEPAQLVVLDPNLLDFEATNAKLNFKLNACLRGKWKEMSKKSLKLKAEKIDDSDQPPMFEKEYYFFVINSDWNNNLEVGKVIATDPDSSQSLQYTLLGEGSSDFKLEDGVLYVSCGMAEKCFDQEREYHLLAMAVDQTGQTSRPASVMINVESTVADECYIEGSLKELAVNNGKLITPFNFIVNNLRKLSIPEFDLKLEGEAAKYFEIERLTRRLHNLKLIGDIPAGTYAIDIVLIQKSGKQRTKLMVTSKEEPKNEFRKKKYFASITSQDVQRGDSILSVVLNGKPVKDIRYLFKGSIYNWLNLNAITGAITLANVPNEDQTVSPTIVAYNKRTGMVFDEITVTIEYTGKEQHRLLPESRVFYYKNDGLKFKRVPGLKTRKIVGYNQNQEGIIVSNGSYNGDLHGDMYISYEMLKSFIFMQIFFVRVDKKEVVYTLLNVEPTQKPAFGYPWTSEFQEIKMSVDSGGLLCLPCTFNGNIIQNVTLKSDIRVEYDSRTSCIQVKTESVDEHYIRLTCWYNEVNSIATIRVSPPPKKLLFDLPDKTTYIKENLEPDTLIERYRILDASKYTYNIVGDYFNFFDIQVLETEVIIKTNDKVDVDYEAFKSMALFLIVKDRHGNSKIGSLTIRIVDQNDNYPVVITAPKSVICYNHWTDEVNIAVVKASDLDQDENGRLSYSIVESGFLSFLSINGKTGVIQTTGSLDKFAREEAYQMSVKVTDNGTLGKSTIIDIPVFIHALIESFKRQIDIISPSENCVVEISEDEKINNRVFSAKAILKGSDVDDGLLRYFISSESEKFSDYLKMDEETGVMSLMKPLDYEEASHLTGVTILTEPNQPISEEDTMHWMKKFRKSIRSRSARNTVKVEDTVTRNQENKGKTNEPSKADKKKETLIRKDTIVVDPKKKLVMQRTKSVTHKEIIDKESRDSPEPVITHFPVNNPGRAFSSGDYDQYGGISPHALWETKKGSESNQQHNPESGYNSPLEVQVSPSDIYVVPLPRSNPRSPSLPPSKFSSPRSPKFLGRTYSHPLDRQRFLTKSESNLRRLLLSDNSEQMILFLRQQVQETKYVTAVFESAKEGIAPILGDIVNELSHWLGTRSRLLAVACEVHWSVPEKIRSRVVEIKMKEELHHVLRQNNSRVLRLYDENGGVIPLSLIDSKTEENCARDAGLDAFQGIYRRYYPALLNLQDYTTMDSHKSYWTLENLGNYKGPLQPAPTKFMYRPSRDVLAKKSIVALNMAVLRMYGDDCDYENEARKS